MTMDGMRAVHTATGEYPIYPGHPITVAWQIIKTFASPSEALTIDTTGGLNCPAAVSDNRISGAGGEVHRACELLRRAKNGASAEELMAWADEAWTSGQAGGHTKAVQPGLAQAEKLKPHFPGALAAWLAAEQPHQLKKADMATMTVAELCKHQDLSVVAANRALAKMQEKGLVTGYVPGDLNAKITLTGAASKFLRQWKANTPGHGLDAAGTGLHITEGISGAWFYHLSKADNKAMALCGARTMITAIPLTAWGARGHLKEGYCATCAKQGADALRAAGVTVVEPIFSLDEVPVQPGARWYLKRGKKVHLDRGFKSKAEADTWIKALGGRLDWRAGYLFRLRGDVTDMAIVNKAGDEAKP